MIEIAVGALLVAGALAALFGVGGMIPGLPAGFDPLPLLGVGGVAFILTIGTALIAAGVTRRAIATSSDSDRRHAFRTARLAAVGIAFTAILAIALPLLVEPLNLIRVDAIPLGYYVAAQGALLGLVVLAFAWATRQARIDREERPHG